MRILSELARSFLTVGNCEEAIRCSDMVLKMVNLTNRCRYLDTLFISIMYLRILPWKQ